ncbi:hypothetical protein Tco_0323122 [Tanacetum coccineum]
MEMESQSLVAGVKARYMVDFVHFALRELDIHSLMIQIRILSMILKIFLTTLHNPRARRILHAQSEEVPPQDDDESILFAITTPLVFEKPFPIPSGLRIFPDIAIEEEVPICDDFTTVSNPLFDADDDFSFSNDESFSDEDIPKEIYSNPLFDEEIIYDKIDALIVSSPKFDSLLEEFSGELTHIDLIPPGINEADFEPEEGIRLVEKLLIALDFEASRARGFVLRSLELQSFA